MKSHTWLAWFLGSLVTGTIIFIGMERKGGIVDQYWSAAVKSACPSDSCDTIRPPQMRLINF
jgi:hypothetical protein